MLFSDVVRDYAEFMRHERNYTERTCLAYRSWLSMFQQWADAEKVEVQFTLRFCTPVLRRWMYSLSKRGLRPRTIHSAFAPMRSLGQYCLENQLLKENPALAITLPKKDAANRPLASDQELAQLLSAAERQADPKLVARDRAILSVLIYCGVRFKELMDLRVQDVSLDSRTLLIASGKGRKSRLLYPNQACMVALAEWLRERAKVKARYDWLWAYDPQRRMGETGLRQLLDQTKARAGLSDHDNIQFHAMRRAYATRCLAKGMDLRSLSASLGHSQASTTLIYTFASERPAEAMRDYADLRSPSLPPEVVVAELDGDGRNKATLSRARAMRQMRQRSPIR
jgi:Site-specific recombinase XerD